MSGEFIVNPSDNYKRAMYLIKELLREKTELTVISGTRGAPTSSKVCENLVRLNYVSYANVKTITEVVNGKRRTSKIEFSIRDGR